MKLLALLPPLVATLTAVDAKIISSKDVDASCGSSIIPTTSASLILDAAIEVEAMMKLGVQALTQSFSTLSAQEQIFQQLIMGTGTVLTANRAAAASILQATLSFAQGRAASSNGRRLWIQCGEASNLGIASASDPGPDGKPLPTRFLYNTIQKRKLANVLPTVAPLYPTVCRPGYRAYVDGSVMVLCSGFWNTFVTQSSRRPIAATSSLFSTERNGKLIVGDSLNRIQDLGSFSILHELMHWGTWDGVNLYTVGDANGYKWVDIANGFSSSPAQTAQFYPFICFGTKLLRDGFSWSKDGKITGVPSS